MIRTALALLAISLLGACSYEKTRTTAVTTPAVAPATVAAPAGSTVITQSPTTTTYTTPGVSTTTVVR
jgi:hypothetical protein